MPDPTTFFNGNGGQGGGSGGWFDVDIADDIVGAILAFVAVIVAGLLFWWIVLPALLLVLDVVIVAALTVLGVMARVLLNRPWVIELTTHDGRRYTRQVKGWRNAQAALVDAAAEIRAGTSALMEPVTRAT